MPGSTYDRGLPLAVVLIGFAFVLLVIFLRHVRERIASAKQSDRNNYEWRSPEERRQDLRLRQNARARSRSRSRVLGFGSSLGTGRTRIQQASLRRQYELRVKQGRRDAARTVSAARLQRRRSAAVEEPDPSDLGRELKLERRSGRQASSRQLSRAAEQRQEELRIEQGMQYARESNFSAKGGGETVSEKKKRARQKRLREGFWRENKSFWM